MSCRPCVADGLPERVTIYEVGPRDGLQNEKALVPDRGQGRVRRRLLAAGLPVVEATSFVHPKWVPQLADAAELMDACSGEARPRPAGAGAQRARPRPGARAGLRHIAIFGSRHRDLRAEEPQPQPRRAVRDVRADRAPGPRRRARRPRLRLDVLRRPVGGRRPGRAGGRGRQAALRPRRQPAQPRRHHRRRHRRPRHGAGRARSSRPGWASTSSRCTSTTPTARRSPTPTPRCRPASRRSTPAPAASAAARTPRAPPATSPPRTWSGCCTGLGHRDTASTSTRSSRPASGWPGSSDGPARRPWSGPWQRQ